MTSHAGRRSAPASSAARGSCNMPSRLAHSTMVRPASVLQRASLWRISASDPRDFVSRCRIVREALLNVIARPGCFAPSASPPLVQIVNPSARAVTRRLFGVWSLKAIYREHSICWLRSITHRMARRRYVFSRAGDGVACGECGDRSNHRQHLDLDHSELLRCLKWSIARSVACAEKFDAQVCSVRSERIASRLSATHATLLMLPRGSDQTTSACR